MDNFHVHHNGNQGLEHPPVQPMGYIDITPLAPGLIWRLSNQV